MARPTISRTDWAELQVEELLSVPLVSEFVFRSLNHNDPDEKEVVDHLIVRRGQSIILSQCFSAPTARSVIRCASSDRPAPLEAAHFDGRDWLFLFIACKKCEKATLFRIMHGLTGAALAQYEKSNCLVIVDRDGNHYDVALSRPDYKPTAEDAANGERHFGPLRMSTVDIGRL